MSVEQEWEQHSGDGYGWLLEQCGDINISNHASHLDNEELDRDCPYCPKESSDDH